jgi:hypothetical protein
MGGENIKTGVYSMSRATNSKSQLPNEKKLKAGINRINSKYGSNLSKFFDAVQAEVKAVHKKTAVKVDSRFMKSR